MVTFQDILDARESIGSLVTKTPLKLSQFLSSVCNGAVYLKLENLQVTNSFKIRGAFNKLLHLDAKKLKHGVVTASAGNHAQGVAIGAEKLNVPATIVVPKTTPQTKIEKIKTHDVNLIIHGDIYDEAERKAIDLSKKLGLVYLSPYNDNYVIAGQGTIGLEILEDLPTVNSIIVPVGGGGLAAGIGVAIKTINPNVRIMGVQSKASPVMYESLKMGKIVNVEMVNSIADGLSGGIEKDAITFRLIQQHLDDFVLCEEDTIRKAICLLWRKETLVVEGAGAVAIAPIIEHKELFIGKTVVCVISGGNIDQTLFYNLLATEKQDQKKLR